MVGPRLKDLGRWFSGGTPPSARPEYWEGELPWLSGKDFDRTRLREPTKFTTSEGADRFSRRMPKRRSVLLLVRGMALAHGLPIARLPFDAAINQDVRGLVVDPRFDQDFVYYALLGQRSELSVHIDRAAHGTARVRETVASHRLPWVPPLRDQRRIAQFLDDETARIEAAAGHAANLGKTLADLKSDIATRAFNDGGPPRPLWSVVDAGRPIMYGIVLPGAHVDGGIPVVKGGDVERERLDPSLLSRTTAEIDAAYARSRLRAGDVLVTIRGSYGACAIVPTSLEGANITQDTARVTPAPGLVRSSWLDLVLRSAQVHDQLRRVAVGATIRGVNIRDLKRLRVPVPPVGTQDAAIQHAHEMLEAADSAGGLLTQQSATLLEYQACVVRDAVSGRLDLKRIESGLMDERLHAAEEGRLDEIPV